VAQQQQQQHDLHPSSMLKMVKIFSALVTAATLPKPTLVRMVNVK